MNNWKKFFLCLTSISLIISVFFLLKNLEQKYPVNTITTYQQAIKELDQADKNTLILFDIDDTLINPVDVMGRHLPTSFKLKAALKYPQLLSRKNIEHYYSIIWLQGSWFVIEPKVIDIIQDLKQRGCVILAISSMETGSFGVIENFPEWRYKLLKNLGLEFNQNFGNIVFNNLPAYRGNHPELYKGILCCNQQPKDKVLAIFLDKYKLRPFKIIFFDDSREAITTMANLCKQRDISYRGFEYHGKQWQIEEWNEQQALWQLDQLITYDKWFSDKEVIEFIESAEKTLGQQAI